jgi:UDP-galactose transporter B1
MIGAVRLAICVSGVYATFLLWAIAHERRELLPPSLSLLQLGFIGEATYDHKADNSVVSVPFPSKHHPTRLQPLSSDDSHKGDRFPSPIFLTFAQAIASAVCAFTYLVFNSWNDGSLRYKTLSEILGFDTIINSIVGERGRILTTPMMQNSARFESPVNSPSPSGTKETKEVKEREKTLRSPDGRRDLKRGMSVGPRTPWRQTLPGLIAQVALFQTTAGPIGFMALEHISYPTMLLGKVSCAEC